MALTKGASCYVASHRIDASDTNRYSMYNTIVTDVRPGAVRVCKPDKTDSDWIGKAAVKERLGIGIIAIGDFNTESNLIIPLYKSINHYIRLLIPDDYFKTILIRSKEELKEFWKLYGNLFTNVILIGHGYQTGGLLFGANGVVNVAEICNILNNVTRVQKLVR